ncbi:flagellin N-terminal helical domain-containing protein, partial [Campylobacter coli]|uniref:flagellin N-terminal helical domain-containing protein n=1 Tax=Campylobacter coli TaxID=195 RepID=UPI000AF1E119
MGFRINTNIGALNAHANSVVNARELDKSLSRLSSGLRINSAADDASGMAIADSLRSQAATLGQAINNGNDAIGILQTADKAMDEQLKILDTIKTKATQAAQDGQSQFQKVVISTSVGTGLGALAEEINKSADQTGVRATFTVETRGMAAVRAGTTSDTFAINGVKIGQVAYEDGDANGALVSAINSVKDTTGVEASIDANGQLLLSSREGRGIKIEGSIGGGAFINKDMMENYGRLSLVKNDGKDILISGTGLSSTGFGASNFISQVSVSLRESKGRFDANTADAMGFGSVNKGLVLAASSIADYMSAEGSGFSAGSGYSVGSGKGYSATLTANAIAISSASAISRIYDVSAGSGFSSGSTLSQFATMKTSAGNSLGAKDETAGVTTLKGAMAVMDIAETAITNL